MAVTNGWGQGAKDNTIEWGQGASDNTISWGKSQTVSAAGDTNITGAGGTPSFVNTKSIALDGVDDFVTMGDVLDFDRQNGFSISCWFKRNTPYTTEFLIDKSESSGNYRGYNILIPNTDNKIYFTLRHTLSNFIQVKSTTAITNSNWNHLLITYNALSVSSGVKMYINGVDDTGTGAGTLSGTTITSQPFEIGARNGQFNFLGNIDEVSVFNSILSASDATAIYNSGTPTDLTSYSPLSWWRCGDGDTSPTLTDNGSGGNNGTMTNFTTFSTDVPT